MLELLVYLIEGRIAINRFGGRRVTIRGLELLEPIDCPRYRLLM
jgi:hypothetical protein